MRSPRPDQPAPWYAQRLPDRVEWWAIHGMLLDTFAFSATTVSTTAPGPTTTAPGSEVTFTGGPNATTNSPGTHNDASDFYGLGLALVVIVGAIVITRLVFRRHGGGSADVEGSR